MIGIGGGRASLSLPHEISRENIEKAVKLSHQNNIKFHYVANSPLIVEDAMTTENKNRVIEEIRWAKYMGVDAIIVSTHFLSTLVARMDMSFIVSKLARVKTVEDIILWSNRGASQICLDLNVIRNLDLLARMQDHTGQCNLQLLVNDACLFKCPYDNLHSHYSSMASQPGVKYTHYYSFKCLGEHFLEKPQEILRATYIRPEDLHHYESLGFDNFKLVDRNRSTDWILNVLLAYTNRKYDGNLAEILSLFSALGRADNSQMQTFSDVTIDRIGELRKSLPAIMDVFIDNKKLQGVFENMQRINCETQVCDVTCNFCKRTAQEIISINGKIRTHQLMDNVFSILNTSQPCNAEVVENPINY
jgi:collagenase-like PrtC family protease